MVEPPAIVDQFSVFGSVAPICEHLFSVWIFQADGVDPVLSSTEMFKVDDFSICVADGEPQPFVGPDAFD